MRISACIAGMGLLLNATAIAHSGGLDKYGCHAGSEPYHLPQRRQRRRRRLHERLDRRSRHRVGLVGHRRYQQASGEDRCKDTVLSRTATIRRQPERSHLVSGGAATRDRPRREGPPSLPVHARSGPGRCCMREAKGEAGTERGDRRPETGGDGTRTGRSGGFVVRDVVPLNWLVDGQFSSGPSWQPASLHWKRRPALASFSTGCRGARRWSSPGTTSLSNGSCLPAGRRVRRCALPQRAYASCVEPSRCAAGTNRC